jgi:hypothetical protein
VDCWGHDEEPEKPHYKTAQICLNGHVRSVEAEFQNDGSHCSECGAQNITNCPNCGAPIHGRYDVPGVMELTGHYTIPNNCHNCGTAYPWTQAKVQALRDLVAEMHGLSQKERDRLEGSLGDLITDTPRTKLTVTLFKKALSKAGGDVATAAKTLLVDIASETVKKSLGIG